MLLRVALTQLLDEPLEGGHFFMLRTESHDFPFLSRPFSVHEAGADSRGPELSFLLKVVGAGTRCLSRLRVGEPLGLVGPLGLPFPRAGAGTHTLLVAGGVGFPPLFLYLTRALQQRREETLTLLYGARSRGQLYEVDRARDLGIPVETATEDGSDGLEGRVDRLLEKVLSDRRGECLRILTCGPDPMMERVAEIAAQEDIPCFVSLETYMACGLGVCNVCAVPVAASGNQGPRFARACIEGPVFEASVLGWSSGTRKG